MRGREHILLGAGSVLVAGVGLEMAGVATISTYTLAGACASAAVGALAPDLDHPRSLASASIPAGLLIYGGGFLVMPLLAKASPLFVGLDTSAMPPIYTGAAWIAVLLAVLLFGLSFAAGAAFGHRGPLHSLVFGIAGSVGVGAATLVLSGPPWVPLLFAWGWATHLASDATTKAGLPYLLWPFGQQRPA